MTTTIFDLHPVSVERGDGLWSAAWATLGRVVREHGLGDGSDSEQLCEQTGERWQFMGAFRVPGEPREREPIVQFRHRSHPLTVDECAVHPARVGCRVLVSVRLGEEHLAQVHVARPELAP